MKKRYFILIMILVLAVSAVLISACGDKIDNETNYTKIGAVLEGENFTIVDLNTVITQSLYPGIEKGFSANRISGGNYESVFVFLFPNKTALNNFVKIKAGSYKEAYTIGLIYYGGGDPLLEIAKPATQIVFDTIGGTMVD